MARNMTQIGLQATIVVLLLAIPTLISAKIAPLPSDKSQLNNWFDTNVKPLDARKGILEAQLATAEAGAKVIKVRKDGSGDFKTVTDAIHSIPNGNSKRVIVWIGGGVYKEKILIERSKPYITLYGSPNDVPTLTFDGTALKYGTVYSASLTVESDYFIGANLIIANSSPKPDGERKGAQAVAMKISGDKAAFYNCKFHGFQDTICDDRGNHFFKDCYIEGTVDFIFGSGKSIYLNTEINVLNDPGFRVITAQARQSSSEDNGFSFVHCTVTGSGTGAYLGRPWMPNPRVVFAYTNMGAVVNPLGWTDDSHPEREKLTFFGEYKNTGPGASPSSRAKFTKMLGAGEANNFIDVNYIQGSKWILPPPKM